MRHLGDKFVTHVTHRRQTRQRCEIPESVAPQSQETDKELLTSERAQRAHARALRACVWVARTSNNWSHATLNFDLCVHQRRKASIGRKAPITRSNEPRTSYWPVVAKPPDIKSPSASKRASRIPLGCRFLSRLLKWAHDGNLMTLIPNLYSVDPDNRTQYDRPRWGSTLG